ncbi:MAG: hypothetical protein OEM29_03650 [Thermoplasmata archaeon]|nr:hypothetical protein [Thermoplasmata archaeon]
METSRKTSSCPCGRKVKLRRSMFKFECDSPLELADMVAQANEKLANGKKFRRSRAKAAEDPYVRVAKNASVLKDSAERAEAIARELTSELGDFGVDDVQRVLSILGRNGSDSVIEKLRDSSIIYEVSEGRYRIA